MGRKGEDMNQRPTPTYGRQESGGVLGREGGGVAKETGILRHLLGKDPKVT